MKALELANRLENCAIDPMWADHCEISKSTCFLAVSELRRLADVNAELLAELMVARSALEDFAGLTEPHAKSLARRFANDISKARQQQ